MADPPPSSVAGYAAYAELPDPAVVVDAAGVVVYANPLAVRLFGLDPTGASAPDTIGLTDERAADWWACARPLDGDARLVTRLPETDLQLRVAGGATRPVTVAVSRIGGPGGRIERIVLVLRRANRRRRLDAARSDLVSTVSHELRSPLTSVKGFTKTLLAKWDDLPDAQKRHMLETVNEDADRVTRLLGELLDVSRIDAGRLRLRRHMLDVPAVIEQVVERLGVDDDADRLQVLLDGDVPKLYADPDKVAQVVTNLVENALKYGEGMVTVTADVGDEVVRFCVSDQGPGIPSGQLSNIFGKFFRGSGERRSGTGLGLYISRGLVEAHGGRIWAENVPEQGARFCFTLPRGGLELAGVEPAATPTAGADGQDGKATS